MIKRPQYLQEIRNIFESHPLCGILGPRQCGKTTLAHMYAEQLVVPVYHFDLEDPTDLAKLEHPKLTLEPLEGLVIIDEIQRRPDLFPYLRVLADKKLNAQYLILGSASRELISQSSESLAGRIGYIELTPLTLNEVEDNAKLWARGGFPSAYLAETDKQSHSWRVNYINNFLERDLRNLGFGISPQNMRRLWMMLAHYHANIINYAEIGRSLQISERTLRGYIDILAGTYMVRLLPAWFENISKRQVKSPKVYIRDSGLLHTLLGIAPDQVRLHPKTGASWEGYALEQIIIFLEASAMECYFWSTQHAAELDLFVVQFGKRSGFEIKYTDAPKVTKSMYAALNDLQLNHLTVIIPGTEQFLIHPQIEVVGLERFIKKVPV